MFSVAFNQASLEEICTFIVGSASISKYRTRMHIVSSVLCILRQHPSPYPTHILCIESKLFYAFRLGIPLVVVLRLLLLLLFLLPPPNMLNR